MTEINARSAPPKAKDYTRAEATDANTLTLVDVNSAEYTAYESGGYVMYYTPVNLSGYTARMKIRDRIGGTELEELTTENGGIALDNVDKTITLLIDAAATEDYTWKKGVYDLEMVAPDTTVTALLRGSVTVVREVTTTP